MWYERHSSDSVEFHSGSLGQSSRLACKACATMGGECAAVAPSPTAGRCDSAHCIRIDPSRACHPRVATAQAVFATSCAACGDAGAQRFACACREIGVYSGSRSQGMSLPRRGSTVSRVRTVLIVALMLPHVICTLDEAPLAETGRKLQACEDRVKLLAAEVGRLQAQLASLQRPGGETTGGGRDGAIRGGSGVRVGTAREGPPRIFAPSTEISTRRDDLDDAHYRRRQEVAGRCPSHRGTRISIRAPLPHELACLRGRFLALQVARRRPSSPPRPDARLARRRDS